MRIRNKRRKRRGILLLLVLSLLVLFVLIGTTFIIVAGHYKTASDAYAKYEQQGEAPPAQLDSVMLELLRGTSNFSSPLAGHSLLEDTYGTDGFVGQAMAALPIANGQLIEVTFQTVPRPVNGAGFEIPSRQPDLNQRPAEFNTVDYFAGSLLTMTNGPLANRTGRILSYVPPRTPVDVNGDSVFDAYTNGTIVIEPIGDSPLVPLNVMTAFRNFQFVVNGRPHNGTGAGYDSSSADLEQDVDFGFTFDNSLETALLPFYRQRTNPLTGLPVISSADVNPRTGGLDEAWDAADYQNIYLAMTHDPTLMTVSSPTIPANRALDALNIPSLHRPFLLNYWVQDRIPVAEYPVIANARAVPTFPPPIVPQKLANHRFLSSLIARPLAIDHPRFNGSNEAFSHPGFLPNGDLAPHPVYNRDGDNIPDFMDPDVLEADAVTPSTTGGDGTYDDFRYVNRQPGSDGLLDMPIVSGPWDVDNDNDGTPDSIWLDLGYPVQTTKDGRRYKPLFAILCVDLDGRLNVNAHGNLAQLETFNVNSGGSDIFNNGVGTYTSTIPSGTATLWGQGYGPADTNIMLGLASVGLNPVVSQNMFLRMLGTRQMGVGAPLNNQNFETLNFLNPTANFPVPGRLSLASPAAETPMAETLNFYRDYDVPANYLGQISSYSTPADLNGRGTIVADYSGNPFYFQPAGTFNALSGGENSNDPYETNLVTRSYSDSLYSLAELEALYRFNDADSEQLDNRLRSLISNPQYGIPESELMFKLLTTKSSSLSTPNTVLNPSDRDQALTIAQLLKQELESTNTDADWLELQLRAMLPRELRTGRKMDVNRPFGNGFDDGDAIVLADNAEEAASDQFMWSPIFGNNVLGRFYQDLTVGAETIAIPTYAPARQAFARQLYCLAMILLRDREIPIANPALPPADRDELKAKKIAQWAINVVDFRDADATMTPFEYDINPFNGWDADGDLTTSTAGERTVWGVEQPELVITETLAIHDLGLRDTDTEDDGEEGVGGGKLLEADGEGTEDSDLDQYKKPVGSLFIELQSPRSPRRDDNYHAYSPELYDNNGRLMLQKVVSGNPVWRIAIQIHEDASTSYEVIAADPTKVDLIEFQPPEADINRIIHFAPLAFPGNSKVYYNMSSSVPNLTPGQIAVVGPRPQTVISSRLNLAEDNMRQRLDLTQYVPHFIENTQISYDTNRYGGDPLLFPCARPSVIAGKEIEPLWNIGVNISEPNPGGYPATNAPDTDAQRGVFIYRDPGGGAESSLDQSVTRLSDAITGVPDVAEEPVTVGLTIPNRATAFLQRLANPSEPWHIRLNPYITVDWAPIDLHIYNGEAAGGEADVDFISRERSGPTAPSDFNIWTNRVDFSSGEKSFRDSLGATVRNFTVVASTDYFTKPLIHSLGLLNPAFGLNYSTSPSVYVVPPNAYPMLTWNNRPFVSALELLQVPASSPDRLLFDYNTVPLAAAPNPYEIGSNDLQNQQNFTSPFGHLFNFFHGSDDEDDSPNLAALFDYLEVPSRFAGTESVLNPPQSTAVTFAGGSVFDDAFAAPFNRYSKFQDPGRINLNTINNPHVLAALHSGAENYDNFRDSLRIEENPMDIRRMPTRFANPFRPLSAADLMPLNSMKPENPVSATILREDPAADQLALFHDGAVATHSNTRKSSLMRHKHLQRLENMVTTQSNVFAVWITVGYFEVHPWDSRDPMNINVTPLPDFAHPDGLQLGQELGIDSGEVERHRAFYIIDRSVPVAFEPGENHNVEDAILLRRFIE